MAKKKNMVMDIYFQTTPSYTVRRETRNGTNYLVVPVVMMVEGVHSGSHGPILHLAEELGRIPESWNGMPVTIGHPQVNGQYVSANSPDVLQDWAVGTIFNTHMDGDALKAEAWIVETQIQALSQETLIKINNGEIIEVSVGVYSDEEHVEGIHHNESYVAIARNHRPDHLALLPGEVGACSINDGCGLRVNKKGGTNVPDLIVNETNQQQILKELSAKGFSVNQMGFTEIANKAQRLLDSMDGDGRIHWLDEIFQTDLVFRVDIRNEDGTRTTKFFRQNYTIKADGNIELTGTPVEVRREVVYTPIAQVNRKSQRTNFNNNKQKKEVTTMSDEKCTECVKKLVDGLIANKSSGWNETHREHLEDQSEEHLELMSNSLPKEKKEEPVVNTAKPEKLTKEGVLNVLKDATEEEFLGAMPESMRKSHLSAKALQANIKAKVIQDILDNTTDGIWTKEKLEAIDVEVLTSIHKSAGIPEVNKASFLANGETTSIDTNAEGAGEPMLPAGIKVNVEQSKN